jgi:hypothetical protein
MPPPWEDLPAEALPENIGHERWPVDAPHGQALPVDAPPAGLGLADACLAADVSLVSRQQQSAGMLSSEERTFETHDTALAADASLGDAWSRIVNQLIADEAVAALAREVALQSELCSQDNGVWTLRVELESLSQAAAREKLQTALQTALGDAAIRLVVQIGAVADTPARRNAAALAERQRAAEALIHNDPLVQEMIRDWGARIVPGSIKSIAT